MADLRIVGAPVLLQESITDDVKMPTGGLGNFSIRLGDIVWYVATKEQLANKNYVDLSSKSVKDSLDVHIADKANPHQVTKAQVGLGNVDNTADIDKPVSNATKSAIITATTDMATKAYVNQKDNLKADITYVDSKDGDLTTLKTTDKTNLVKAINEVYDDTKGVVALYDKNVEAGAGANGWTDTLIAVSENINQRQINDGLESIAQLAGIKNPRNGQRVYVKSYYAGLGKGGGTFVYDSTKSTINDGVVVFNGWVRQLDNNTLTPEMAGAKADYVDQANKGTDDSEAFQKVIAYFKENPCVIECDPLAKHYIANPIIIPDRTDIRGNGAQLFGNDRLNDCFYTGYYVNGVLTPLYDKPDGTKYLTNTKLRGFHYRYFKASMKLRGMTQGCAIEDVSSKYCNQHLWSREHYFCTFRQSYADWCGTGTKDTPVEERTAVYDLWTLNGMINIETIQCSSASLAYRFYSLQSTEISHLDAESCATAIRLRGVIENADIHGNYFENCGDILDVSGSVVYGGAFRNNFCNHFNRGIVGTGANCNINEFDNRWIKGGDEWAGIKSVGSATFRVHSKEDSVVINHKSAYPAPDTPKGTVTNNHSNYATSNGSFEQQVSVYDEYSGANLVKAKSYMGSVIPFTYYGKYPKATTNNIPFCSHTASAVGTDNTFSIRITTSIEYSEFVRGDFALNLTTNDNDKKIFGRFFGLNGVIDFNGFSLFTPTITIENVEGVIVLVLSGIKNTNNSNSYVCRGIVKLS